MSTSVSSAIDLNAEDLQLVQRFLAVFLPTREVRAFGSRVQGRARKFSDLDLVVMGDAPLTLREYGAIKTAFESSDLPIRVDIVEWARTSPAFRKIIEDKFLIIQPAAPPTNAEASLG